MLRALIRGLLLSATLLLPQAALAQQESIQSFDVLIEVEPSGDLRISEEIAVIASHQQVKRGIFRDLPVRSFPFGNFEIIAIRRNGQPENYFTEGVNGGLRIYIGEDDRFVERGLQVYTIEYRVEDELRFQEDYDEVYWNATGNGWAFPIERATATVILPAGTTAISSAAYTGRYGEAGRDFRVASGGPGRVVFTTTRALWAGEGLTVAVAFPKGAVEGPSQGELFIESIGGRGTVIGAAGFLMLLIYYLFVWNRVGRDAKGRPIVPRYELDLPPAAARFIDRMSFDRQTFTAALLSLAVKGHILIEEPEKGAYRISRAEAPPKERPPSAGERKALQALLGSEQARDIAKSNRSFILAGEKALKNHLESVYNAEFFSRNRGYFITGLIATLALWLLLALGDGARIEVLFMSVWLPFWTIGVLLLLYRTYLGWRDLLSGGLGQLAQTLIMSFMSLGFLGGWIAGAAVLVSVSSLTQVIFGFAAAALNAIFFELLKVRTHLGREVMDDIEGLRLYLSVAEKDRMNFHNPPDRTPEHFEALLPYALALGVENKWAEQFSGVFDKMASKDASAHPRWYRGGRTSYWNMGDMGRRFSNAVGAASAAQRSGGSGGGGSFGGGFSGGGGGGGGGGGW